MDELASLLPRDSEPQEGDIATSITNELRLRAHSEEVLQLADIRIAAPGNTLHAHSRERQVVRHAVLVHVQVEPISQLRYDVLLCAVSFHNEKRPNVKLARIFRLEDLLNSLAPARGQWQLLQVVNELKKDCGVAKGRHV